MPISSPFRSKEKTEEQRCGQSAHVKKYSIYFWGITIPIGSGKMRNEEWKDHISDKAILPCFGNFKEPSFFFVFFFVHEIGWETIDFGRPCDLRVEIFYCCCNGIVSLF